MYYIYVVFLLHWEIQLVESINFLFENGQIFGWCNKII